MADDLGAKFVRINAAKKAAADLRQLSSACKTAFLRDEGGLFVNDALGVIKSIEEVTLDYNCNLLPETIGKAALKAEDTLRVLTGRIAAADRQAKPNLLGLIGRQLSNPHKQMFKDARDSLKQVLPMMTEAADADLTDSDNGDAAQQQQLQEQLSQNNNTELRLTYQGNKVSTVALTPGPTGSIGSGTLWVALKQKVEFFVGCNTNNKSEVLTEKGQGVTCAIFDNSGGVYTGHAHGVVKLHLQGAWGAAQHPSSVGLPVRSMAVDSRGFCWVGDEAGIIRVLMLDPQTCQLNLKMQLVPPQAQGLLNLAIRQGPAAAAAAFNEGFGGSNTTGLARLGSGTSSTGAVKPAPIAAMCSKGLAVFSAGGKSPYNIVVWHSQKFSELEVSSCESFGAPCSFAVLPWEAPPDAAGPGRASIDGSSSSPAAQSNSSTAVAGVPATGIAVGYATVQPRATVPPRIMAQSLAKQAAAGTAGSASGTAPDTSDYSSWRLLSGHERGQVLLWQFNGVTRSAGTTKLLQLLSVIGDPRPQCAVRGMAIFEDLSMLALVHASGDLTAMPMPKYNNLPSSGGSSGASFSAVGVPAGGSGVMFGAASLHHWRPRVAHIKAHKSPIVATSCLGEMLVTATGGTIKSWTAERLKLEAQGDGLMFSRKNKAYSTGSTAAALEAAIAAADNCTSSGSAAPGSSSRASADRADAAAAAVVGLDQEVSAETPVRQRPQQLQNGPAGATARAPGPAALVPAACKATNPMSRESVMARGMQVDATNKVVVRQHEPTSTFIIPVSAMSNMPGYPLPTTNGQVSTMLNGGQAPARLQHTQSTPVGSGGLDAGGSSGGLEASQSSVTSEGIKPHHVICNSELVLKEVIGSGAEGKVYRGTWTNIDIAAKEYLAVDEDEVETAAPNSDTPSEAAMQKARNALRKEVALLMCFNHPNLVRFCGVCLDPPLVVMEFYKHGNVFQMIEKARRQWVNNQGKPGASPPKQATKYMNYFTWDRRLEMLHDVAAGMMYLHKRHYVHGDLRSPNLFVGLDGRVKIGDFGFTKRLNSKQSSMQVKRITHPRWVAPELMTESRLSTASDVYSFGIIMYEMLTWQLPFYDLGREQVVFHVMKGARPDIPVDEQMPPGTSSSTCLGNYIKLMQECWDQEVEQRPLFEKIAARLKAMIRWRMVIQRNKLLAGVASKLKAAGMAHRAVFTPPPAIIATEAQAEKDTADLAAAATSAAAHEMPQMAATAAGTAPVAGSAFASSLLEPVPAARTVDEEDPEDLPRPEHPIVHVPEHVAEAVIDPSAVDPLVIQVARAKTAPAAAVARGIEEALAEANTESDADEVAAPPAGEEAAPVVAGQVALQQPVPQEAVEQAPAAPAAAAATVPQQQQVSSDSPFAATAAARPPAARAPIRRSASGRRSDTIYYGPNGQQFTVGSDVPESPCSQCTLSTKASNDVAGLSTTTEGGATMGLSTPTTSMLMTMPEVKGSGIYELQTSKSFDATKHSPTSPVQSPQSAVPPAAVTLDGEQPGSPPPPGYPVVGRVVPATVARTQPVSVRSVVFEDVPATVARTQPVSVTSVTFEDGPFALVPVGGDDKQPALPAVAPGVSIIGANSSVLTPASASTKLDPIQETSESASGTASGTVSSGALVRTAASGGAVPGAFGSFSHAASADAAAGGKPGAGRSASTPVLSHGPLSPVPEQRLASDTAAVSAHSLGQQQQQDMARALSAAELSRRRTNASAAECKVTTWLQQADSQPSAIEDPTRGKGAAVVAVSNGTQQYQQAQQGQLLNHQLVSGLIAAAPVAAAELHTVDSGISPFLVTPHQQQQQQHLPQERPAAAASAASPAPAAVPLVGVPCATIDTLDSQPGDAGPFGLRTTPDQHAQQEQHSIDYFTAQDSPFFQNYTAAGDSGSVKLDNISGAAGGAGARPAAFEPSQPGCPAYMSTADYLDDSKLPMDDDEPRLGAAITVVYPEGQAPVDAAVRSNCMLKTTSSSNYTMPSLEEGVAGAKVPSVEPPASSAPATSEGRVVSFTAAEASPFANLDLCDDPCESVGLGGALKPLNDSPAPIDREASPFAAPAGPADAATSQAPAVAGPAPSSQATAAAGQQSSFYAAGLMYNAGMYPGPFMPGAVATGMSMGLAAPPLAMPGFGYSAGMVVGSPQQPQQLMANWAQHQRAPALQADGMPAWQQTGLMPQQQGWMGCNTAALSAFQLQALMQAGYAGIMPGQCFTGQYPGPVPAADNRRPSRGSSGIPEYNMSSAVTQDSLQPVVGAGGGAGSSAAALDGAAAADGSALKHYKPLSDDVLNKRLGASDEDVPEQAKKALEAWEKMDKTFKSRRASASSGDVSKQQQQPQQQQQQQQDGASDLVHVPNASDVAARTSSPAAVPPAMAASMMPYHANGTLQTQLMGHGFGFPGMDPAAAMMMCNPLTAAAGGAGIPGSSMAKFSQPHPGERIKVVNRPQAIHTGPMDPMYLAHMQMMQMQSPGAVNSTAAMPSWPVGIVRPAGPYAPHPPQQVAPVSPRTLAQQQQQHDMIAAAMQQQQLQQTGRVSFGGMPVGPVASQGYAAGTAADPASMAGWTHTVAGHVAAGAQPDLGDAFASQQQQQQQAQLQQIYQHMYMQQMSQQQPQQQQPNQSPQQPFLQLLLRQQQPQSQVTLQQHQAAAVPLGFAPAQQQQARLQQAAAAPPGAAPSQQQMAKLLRGLPAQRR